MKPVFAAARENPKRIIFSEGEDERVLRAVQQVVDEGLARPILIGRPDVVMPTSSASACAWRPSATSSWSIRIPIRASRTSCGSTTTA
jgi:phosphotransacetylase